MQLTRTTIRLQTPLKKAAEKFALDNDTTFQAVMNQALKEYIHENDKQKAKKILFLAHDTGAKPDNLTRDDIYAD